VDVAGARHLSFHSNDPWSDYRARANPCECDELLVKQIHASGAFTKRFPGTRATDAVC
jgi:hypothetical protein